jgi:hypothetical protein
VAADHLLYEQGLCVRDTLDGLARHRLGQEADEVAGMTGLHRDAYLAVCLETADSRTMTRARIDHDEGPSFKVNLDALRRYDAHERVVDWLVQLTPVHDQFGGVLQDVWRSLCNVLMILVAATAQDVQEQDVALSRVAHVFDG